MSKSDVTLRGIVVTGDSRQQAEDSYRAVATGVSVKALRDDDNKFIILSNAESDLTLMNPLNGDMNLVDASDTLNGRLEFLASDADETVTTFYTLCSDGCGSHLIADDPKLMVRCPVCASELADLSEDEIADLVNKQNEAEASEDTTAETAEESDGEPNAIVATASTFEEAAAAFRALAEGEVASKVYDCEVGRVVASAEGEFNFSPYTGEAANATEENGAELKVEASTEGNYDAHWYVCASDECGTHVVASTESPVFCPKCSSGLIEPEAAEVAAEEQQAQPVEASGHVRLKPASVLDDVTASDDDEEDEEEEEEDLDEESDEDEDDEDGDDDSDEDEESDEDESEEDEDEDFDDDNSLSVASVTIEDEPATEAVADAPMTAVATNLLALASASGELKADKLEVAFAGSIAGEATWLAFYNGLPVAKATASSTTAEQAVFAGPVFGNLVLASAKENGVSAALNELGFSAIEASVNVDNYVQDEVSARVEASVAEARANFEKSSNDFSARFLAALATAASGVNKGFFNDVSNPIKGALVATMTSVGIRNADKLVAQAYARHNDVYLQGLLKKASEIMEFDVNVQNQLTKAVATASDEMSVTASAGHDQLSIGIPVAKQVQPEQRQEATASAAKKPNLDVVLSTLGKRRN